MATSSGTKGLILGVSALGALLFGACGGGGGGGGPTAPPAPTPRTLNVSGTAVAVTPTGCTPGSHAFQAADGPISVTLLTTTNNVGLAAQVCAGNDNGNCSINQVPIAIGQTVTGTRRGGAGQNLVLNPANCGGGGPMPTVPIQYTATVTFLQ